MDGMAWLENRNTPLLVGRRRRRCCSRMVKFLTKEICEEEKNVEGKNRAIFDFFS